MTIPLILLLVGLGAVASRGTYEARLDIEYQRVETRAAEAAAALEQFFLDRMAVLATAAAFPAFTDGDAAARSRALDAASNPQLGFSGGVGWIDADGMLVAESGAPADSLPLDLSDRPYVQDVLRDGRAVVSDPIQGRLSGDVLVVIAVPGDTGGTGDAPPPGMLIASVLVSDLDDTIRTLSPPQGLRIVDDDGRLVMIDGEAGPLEPVPRPAGIPSDGDGVGVGAGIMDTPDTVTAASPAATPGWTVVAEADAASLSSAARSGLLRELAVLIALAAIGVAAVVWSTRRTAASQARARRFAGDLAAIEQLTERLSASETRRDVAEAAAACLSAEFTAAVTVVALVDPSFRRMETLASRGGQTSVLREFRHLPLDTGSMLTDAWREGRTVVLDIEEYCRQYPATAEAVRSQGVRAAVAVPYASRVVSGAVCVAFDQRARPSPDDVRRLEAMAPLLGDAFERAHATDRQAAGLATMQRALLPDDLLPGDSRVQRAARYLPAGAADQIGGDWYDIVESGGRTVVTVGDVVGRGIPAAAVMGQLRSACRAIAFEHADPAVVLHRLDAFARTVTGAFASTVVVCVVDPDRHTATLASAGHPPPVIATSTGVDVLHDVRGKPLAVSAAARAAVTIPFHDSDTLVLYTDGLVERRGEALSQGIARLLEAVTTHRHLPVGVLADRLVSVAAGHRGDDISVVCLRPAAKSGHTFSYTMAARPSELSTARAHLRRWLHASGVDGPRADEVLLAVSEVTSNAVEHGYRGIEGGVVVIEGEVQEETLCFTVTDKGRWIAPDPTRSRGRGLSIVRALGPDLSVRPTEAGTTVTFSMERAPPA